MLPWDAWQYTLRLYTLYLLDCFNICMHPLFQVLALLLVTDVAVHLDTVRESPATATVTASVPLMGTAAQMLMP